MQSWRVIICLVLLGCSSQVASRDAKVADTSAGLDIGLLAETVEDTSANADQIQAGDLTTSADATGTNLVCQSTLWHKKLLAYLGVYRIAPSGSTILVAGARNLALEFSGLARDGGQLKWDTGTGYYGRTNAVVARAEGGWLTAGWIGFPADLNWGSAHARIIRAYADDGTAGEFSVKDDGTWWDLAERPGGFLAAAELPDGGHVTAFTATFGTVQWDAAIPGMAASRAVLPGSPIVVAGLPEVDTATGAGLLVATLTPDGALLKNEQVLEGSEKVSIRDVVHMHGHILVIGGQVTGQQKQLVLIRVDGQGQAATIVLHGKTYWWREPGSGVVFDDGGIMASGRGYSFTDPEGALVSRLDRFGNVVSEKVIPVPFQGHVAEAIAEDGNGFLVDTNDSGEYFVTIHRVDAWANADCETSGPCFAKAYADCADDNPCTNDLCDAQHGGCYHVPLAVGSTCSDAGAHCSSSGACE